MFYLVKIINPFYHNILLHYNLRNSSLTSSLLTASLKNGNPTIR